MANLVKVKTIGIGFSFVVILISFSQFDLDANQANRYKMWSPDSILYSDDFMKTIPIFDEFDARIRARVTIHQLPDDSIRAITQIDRFASWIREKAISSYLLTHEMYHANITYLLAKKINQAIAKNNLSYDQAIKLRDDIHSDYVYLQSIYDEQTNHSINKPMQHYWEYKVDSMLNFNNVQHASDIFSGATAFFPKSPIEIIRKDTFMLVKDFQLINNGMVFTLSTHYDENIDTLTYEEWKIENFRKMGLVDIKSQEDNWNDLYMLRTECADTSLNISIHTRAIINGNNTYELTVESPLNQEINSPYEKMRNTFFSSFKLISNDSFWKSKLLGSGEKNITRSITEKATKEQRSEHMFTSISVSDNSLFYNYPFIDRNSVILAYKPERHTSSDVKELMVILNDSIKFTLKPDTLFQIFPVDLAEFSNGENHIQFGYFTKSDSSRKMPHFYSSVIKDFILEK